MEKEARKDALAIRCAGEALGAREAPAGGRVAALLRAAQDIDREFLERAGRFPVRLVIRYEDIAPVRMRRMQHLVAAASAILGAWAGRRGIRAVVRACFTQAEFAAALYGHLHLYAVEVRALSRSVRLPALIAPLRDGVARDLYEIMERQAHALAADLARSVYAGGTGAGRCDAQATRAIDLKKPFC